jgi:uncharacterized protein (TIGR02145 family)
MKAKSNLVFFSLFLTGILSFFLQNCKEEDSNPDNPYNGKTSAVFNPGKTYGTLTDIDGNVYKTIAIGTHIWMAENLRTTRYKDSTYIHFVPNAADWNNQYDYDAYCNYNNTSSVDSIATYGRLYNGWAVKSGKLAPSGWHIAKDEEWAELVNILGGDSLAGCSLQETGSLHWISPYISGTNESGFTAIPGGSRWGFGGYYSGIGYSTLWWSYSENIAGNFSAWKIYYPESLPVLETIVGSLADGYSVRCIKN